MSEVAHTAVLGAGVIGSSWAALFLAAGRSVTVFDPSADVEAQTRAAIDRAWPTLDALGLTDRGTPDALHFAPSAADAVAGATFAQPDTGAAFSRKAPPLSLFKGLSSSSSSFSKTGASGAIQC